MSQLLTQEGAIQAGGYQVENTIVTQSTYTGVCTGEVHSKVGVQVPVTNFIVNPKNEIVWRIEVNWINEKLD